MAGDRQQFKRALARWLDLQTGGFVGVPVSEGRAAILTSPFTDEPPETSSGVSELAAFKEEAHALADRVCRAGGRAEVAIDVGRSDFDRLVADPGISSMYVIGNGALSNLMLGVSDYYDWSNVADATTHLKQGVFVQRQCGGLSRATNVPLGMFAMNDARSVLAAVGNDSFNPKSLEDPENDAVRRVFDAEVVTYEMVKDLRARLPVGV